MGGFCGPGMGVDHNTSAAFLLARTLWLGPRQPERRLTCNPGVSPGRSWHRPVGKAEGRAARAPGLRVKTPGSNSRSRQRDDGKSCLAPLGLSFPIFNVGARTLQRELQHGCFLS